MTVILVKRLLVYPFKFIHLYSYLHQITSYISEQLRKNSFDRFILNQVVLFFDNGSINVFLFIHMNCISTMAEER